MDFNRYVGLPWRDQGRDWAGVDCYGLLYLFYREELGVELPAYTENYVSVAEAEELRILILGEVGRWIPIPAGEEQPGDGILLRGLSDRPPHIGVVAGDGKMLHIPDREQSVVQPYYGMRWKHRVKGFYRWQ